ncbi:MAG: hypothetical protein EBZ96_05455 [Synechococcaceae bacterium WB9_3_282]|nr:hypothetical protein [Synechococcaceae bacterium WB9_3_282]
MLVFQKQLEQLQHLLILALILRLIWILILTLSGFALGNAYTNVELWIQPVAQAVKIILVIAAIAFAFWLGLRVWRRR